jgi:hypothetical protein
VGRKKRNYAAEYKRRIARATAKGYTRDIARGHPKKGSFGIKAAKFLKVDPGPKPSFEQSLKLAGFTNLLEDTRKAYLKRIKAKVKRGELSLVVTSQEEFIQVVMETEYSANEAYSAWFGSPQT